MAPEAGPLEGQRCTPTSAGRASCPERPTWSRRATAERERPAVLGKPSELLRGRSVSWSLSHGSRREWSFGDSAGSHVLLCDLERIVPVNGQDQVVATVQDEITNEEGLRKVSGKGNREERVLRASVAVARLPEKQGEPAERVEPSRASLHGRGRFCSFGGDFRAEMGVQELPATLKTFFLPYLTPFHLPSVPSAGVVPPVDGKPEASPILSRKCSRVTHFTWGQRRKATLGGRQVTAPRVSWRAQPVAAAPAPGGRGRF